MRPADRPSGLFIGPDRARITDYTEALGLPSDASWSDISREQTERYRLNQARFYGLPETASFPDIMRAQIRFQLKNQ